MPKYSQKAENLCTQMPNLLHVLLVEISGINVTCEFTITAISSLIFSMKRCKIQVVPGFVQNDVGCDFFTLRFILL